jgi:hypothetical protein
MKLKVFNKLNAFGEKEKAPSVCMNPTSRSISFNREAIDKLSISDGVLINFIQDEERSSDWYIQVTKDPNGFTVSNKNSVVAVFSKSVVAAIFESVKAIADKKISHRFFLGNDFVKNPFGQILAILTLSAKPTRVLPETKK